MPINNTSDYKGVSWRKGKVVETRIRYKGSRLYLGRLEHAQDAALDYDVASRHSQLFRIPFFQEPLR